MQQQWDIVWAVQGFALIFQCFGILYRVRIANNVVAPRLKTGLVYFLKRWNYTLFSYLKNLFSICHWSSCQELLLQSTSQRGSVTSQLTASAFPYSLASLLSSKFLAKWQSKIATPFQFDKVIMIRYGSQASFLY